jgi:competence protein ComEC
LAQLPLAELTLPAGPAALVFVAAFVASAAAIARGRRPRAHAPHPRRRAPVLVVLVLAANAFVWPRAIAPDPSLTGLIVDMVDVGQGEAIVVRAGRSLMLVDGGPDPRRTFEALRARDIGRIDLLVSTHPHEDHVAGLVPVARIMTIGRVLDPMLETDLASYGAFVDALEHRRIAHVPARAGDSFALGPARVDVLWPPDDLMAGTGSDTNNNSIVLAVTYGADRVLLAGETEEEAQQAMLDAGVDLRADVLKVSHHGSARMVPAFYAATGASHALIPVGDNTYGHPAPETLAALEGMTVWRSDLHGDVAAAIDGDAAPVQVRAQRTARG